MFRSRQKTASHGGRSNIRKKAKPPSLRRRGLLLEPLESRFLLDASPLRINEFMAINQHGLTDENGAYSDWIELYNSSATAVDLFGWHLTDNAGNPAKWTFPHKTMQPGEHLIVFASGKDRPGTGPNGELHTNFSLSGDGEYLALVQPDGTTIATQFAPRFPPQREDVAYGVGSEVQGAYVAGAATLRYFVPTSDALGRAWTGGSEPFDDSAWTAGTSGLGYDLDSPTPAAARPVGYWNFENDVYDASGNTRDGLAFGAYRTSATPAALGPGWSFNFDGGNDYLGVPIDVSETAYAVSLWFKADTGSRGLFSIAEADRGGSYDRSIWLNGNNLAAKVSSQTISTSGKNYVDGQWHHVVHTFGGTTGGQKLYVDGQLVASGTTTSSAYSGQKWINIGYARDSGTPYFKGSIDDVAIWSQGLNLAQIQALAQGSAPLALAGYAPLTSTNVNTAMKGQNASIYARLTFTVTTPADFDGLQLRVQYDDGFVAYLNGVEVARRNFTGTPQWNSAAAANRGKAQAIVAEQIDLSAYRNLLVEGTNILAFQGLNDQANGNDFLLRPELVRLTTASYRPMAAPSPGAANDAGLVEGVQFSKPAGAYTTAFSLTLSVPQAGTVIRYTTNGTIPNETSPAYSAPLNITTTMRIRARAYDPTRGWGPIVSQSYLFLESNVATFTSDLPVVVLDTFGLSTPGDSEILTPVSSIFLEPGGNGRTVMTATPDFAGRGGMRIRGSSSQGFEKKQYAFETWGENVADNALIDSKYAEDIDVPLLGLPAGSDWVLNGPYSDKSLLRNYLSYGWFEDIGHYSVRTRLVEVFLNTDGGKINYSTDYVGVYVFIEKIKIDDNRVDIPSLDPSDNAEPDITGGYIFKRDRQDADEILLTTSRQNLVVVEPKSIDMTAAQQTYLLNYLNQFEAALYGANFADPVNGYAKYIDPLSFVDSWILVEMTKQIDGYRLSSFYYKDRGGKIKMGPIWDYNLSLGNANYNDGGNPQNWYWSAAGLSDADYPYFRRLYEDKNFTQLLTDRWYELRQTQFSTAKLMADIDAAAAEVSEAQARNFTKWQILPIYVWPNTHYGTTWQAEIDWMKNWLTQRVAWMDTQFLRPVVFNPVSGAITPTFKVALTAPGGGSIYYTLDGSDPRLAGGGISPKAVRYTAAFSLANPCTVRARAYDGSRWSAPTQGVYLNHAPATPANLAITEINYNPAAPTAAELAINAAFENNDFEFVELRNVSGDIIDLTSVQFTAGIDYSFPADTMLQPGQYVVLAVNPAAFQARYGTGIVIAGTYTGKLNNSGERLALMGLNSQTLHDFTYGDSGAWSGRADGKGSTLELVSAAGDYGDPANWRPSSEYLGTPGSAGAGPLAGVVINEILAHTDPPLYDAIELHNPTTEDIDLGGWYLSDSSNNYKKFRIPDGTILAAGEYLVYDATTFGIVEFASATEGMLGTAGSMDDGATLQLTGNGWKRIKLPHGITANTILEFDFKSGVGGEIQGIGVARDDTLDYNSIFRLAGSEVLGRDEFADYSGADWKHYSIPLGEFAALALNGLVLVNDADGEDPGNPAQCFFRNVTLREPGGDAETIDFRAYFSLDAARGEDVYLMKTDAAGNLAAFADHVDFSAQASDTSLGRWRADDGAWRMTPLRQRTLGAANDTAGNGPRFGPLVISEVMYWPKALTTAEQNPGGFTSADQMEFIEIFNPTSTAVSLTNWRLGGAVGYEFAAGSSLAAGGRLVIAGFNPANATMLSYFRTRYAIGTTVAVVGPFSDSMPDTGGKVQLLRPDLPPPDEPTYYPGLLEDEARFLPAWGAAGDHKSLTRANVQAWGFNASAWGAGAASPGTFRMVAARRVFYNSSSLDGRTTGASVSDDNAIATDKTPLMPGGTATFANYTSSSQGLNGVMVDFLSPASTAFSAADFSFRVGNDNDPTGWTTVAATGISSRSISGLTRVTIIFADGLIQNQWLEVTVKIGTGTHAGLVAPDAFYFGNAVGETGNRAAGPDADAAVDVGDEDAVRANRTYAPAAADNPYDFNRDRRVDSKDELIARSNYREGAAALQLINPGAVASAAAMATAGGMVQSVSLAETLAGWDESDGSRQEPAETAVVELAPTVSPATAGLSGNGAITAPLAAKVRSSLAAAHDAALAIPSRPAWEWLAVMEQERAGRNGTKKPPRDQLLVDRALALLRWQ